MRFAEYLLEDKRTDLLSRGRRGEREKGDNKTRYEKRVKSKFSSSTREYNRIDMNSLFKDNILTVNIPVVGETNDYLVTIKFGGFLDLLRRRLEQQDNILDLKVVIRALIDAFNSEDVYIHCSCLHPDTKIKLLDGSTPTILELLERYEAGESLWVYSVDEHGDFKPGKVEKVWQTSISKKLIKITLDNDKTITTTPDHLYMRRTGEYTQAQDLQVGDSLMPLYFNRTKNDYDTVKINSTGKYHSIYKLVAEALKSDEIEEAISRVIENDSMKYPVAIHHRDFNKHNNNPDNLQIMTAREHWEYHARLCGPDRPISDRVREISRENAIKRNANPTPAMIESRKKFQEKGRLRNYDQDRRAQQSEIAKKTFGEYYKNITEEQKNIIRKRSSEISKKNWAEGIAYTDKFKQAAKRRGDFLRSEIFRDASREGIKKYWDNLNEDQLNARIEISKKNIKKATEAIRGVPFTDEHKRKISQAHLSATPEEKATRTRKIELTKIKKVILKIIENKEDITLDNYLKFRTPGTPSFQKYFESLDEAVKYFELNHKVRKIEWIEEETPVYDIKVEKYHNFLVDAGVILHNCPDWKYRMAYWCTVTKVNSGEPELIPSDITNPKNTLGPGCKHVMLVLANTSWLIKVASVIVNYIKYMESHRERDYANIIYPAIYGKKYEKPVQTTLFDTDELETDQETIDISNKEAREKGQFKKGNPTRFQPRDKIDQDQLSLELEDEADNR